MKTYLIIGLAGAFGAMLRYCVGLIMTFDSTFPYATLTVNLIGAFLLAWVTTRLFQRSKISPTMMSAISTGFIGSFTTFSAVSVEAMKLLQNSMIVGLVYVLLSILGGLIFSQLGFSLGKKGEK